MTEPARVRVVDGITLGIGDDQWRKREIEVESPIPGGMTTEEAIKDLEQLLQARLAEFELQMRQLESKARRTADQPQAPASPRPAPTPSSTMIPSATSAATSAEADLDPELDPSYLDSLEWRDSQRNPNYQWRFADETRRLAEHLRGRGWIQIGGYRYKLMPGEDREFVGRVPAK